jgi:hypothetical protein
MAIRAVWSAIGDLAGVGHGALDGVKVLTDFAADRDAENSLFKGSAKSWEEFCFQSGGELGEFDLVWTKFLEHVVAEADAGAGVVEANFATALEAWGQDRELFGGGGVF